MIAQENLEFKGPTRWKKHYFMVGQPLDFMDGDKFDLIISIYINANFMILIKGVEQYPDLGENIIHPSIECDSKATDIDTKKIMMIMPTRNHIMVKI